ncbi:gamma-aminobutyric acid type B receptor subunit 1-like [Gigantopelta aegis]|uniref:gamma-aminobutyric acid type B receptor subunit 1-like n=1 Tax=Gigantopelta aegis TaxID=1735272 RepID=UPI001B88C6B6|nr:gamma-aminobutyric acid type B receptor subunit 1-like [Gigantopelta aegis]
MRLFVFVVLLFDRKLSAVTDLFVLAMQPMTGPWPGGDGIREAATMALEDVNGREDVLAGYNLSMIWVDSEGDAGLCVNRMYESLYRPLTKIAIFGASRSPVTEATARSSHHWNLLQISSISSSPALSDKNIYPRFFRTNSPELSFNAPRMDFIKQFGWKKIATMHGSDHLFALPIENMIELLRSNNIEIIRSEIITKNPTLQVANLKKYGARIIIALFYESVARQVFCEAYKIGFYGPKIVWIISGWYESSWWQPRSGESLDCTTEQMGRAAEGAVSMKRIHISPLNEKTIGGIVPRDFFSLLDKRTNSKKFIGHAFLPKTYDAVWALSLALNATMTNLTHSGSSKGLENFTYSDQDMADLIVGELKNVRFMGLPGLITFNEHHDAVSSVFVRRLQDLKVLKVGLFDPTMNAGVRIKWQNPQMPIRWKDGRTPKDSMTIYERTERLSLSSYVTMCCLAGAGIILNIGFLFFNVHYRHARMVKMSSPRLNNLTLVGCFLLYLVPLLGEYAITDSRALCMLRFIILVVGFSLAYGALFVKTWRVYVIFTNSTKQKNIVTDTKLIVMLGLLVLFNVLVLCVWFTVDPVRIVNTKLVPLVNDAEDIEIRGIVKTCDSENQIYFLGILFGIQGILMLLGSFLAYETRKVSVPGLNDSKMIGVAIYNVVVLSVLGVTVSLALRLKIDLTYCLSSGILILATTVTQCLIMVPKIVNLTGNAVGSVDDTVTRNATHVTDLSSRTQDITRLIKLERELIEKERRIKELEEGHAAKDRMVLLSKQNTTSTQSPDTSRTVLTNTTNSSV